MVMEAVHEDMGEGNMQHANHPYKNSTPGGICAFCLQEKLGKLVSSSSPAPIFPSSSSSSSSRSDFGGTNTTTTTTSAAAALQAHHLPSSSINVRNDCNSYHGHHSSRPRLPFVLTQRKKKKKEGGVVVGGSDSSNIVFKRSKSTVTPRRGMHLLDENFSEEYSPHRRGGFWSFLHLSNKHSTPKKSDRNLNFTSSTPSTVTVSNSSTFNSVNGVGLREKKREDYDQTPYDRKVSRSRSVGCGSRSFSNDLFERISTGLGDCTLRRVESQREGNHKVQPVQRMNGGQDCIKERVRCGGIFGGFMITSSSSWGEDNSNSNSISMPHSSSSSSSRQVSHGRSKSWGWALASPMRAFSKPPSLKRDGGGSNDNVTPNLAAIPSLLAVSG